jgi:hypothetical protein
LHGEARNPNLLPELVDGVVRDHSPDVIALIECGFPIDELVRGAWRTGREYFSVRTHDRFKLLVGFSPELLSRIFLPVETDRFDLWEVRLPLQQSIIMGVVHGLDIRNNGVERRSLFLQQVASNIEWAENLLGHRRTVLFGDMNAHPFEIPMGSTGGLHAVVSRRVAATGEREILNETYRYFYNPMWNLMGDFRTGSIEESPAGTYYYRSGQPHELYWSMLDQMVLRPDILAMFDHRSLKILDTVGGTPLLTRHGIPNRGAISDHLPVIFDLDLKNEKPGD